jgi:DNA polymerase III epsilon subunit-like protein
LVSTREHKFRMKINTQQALNLFAININRPLAFIDLETTGINISVDRIVQICILKLYPDQAREVKNLLLNPTIPIPMDSQRCIIFMMKL